MQNKQLASHIATRLKSGISAEELRDELSKSGWPQADMEEAFRDLISAAPGNSPKSSIPSGKPSEKAARFSPSRILHSDVPAIVLLPFVAAVIAIFAVVFIFFRSTTLSYSINLPTVPEPTRVAFTYGEQPALSDPDFFGKVKKQFIGDKTDFIEADLSAMMLRVYKAGEMSLEVPINSKGYEGSWWETPAGLYKISNKEKAHFSSMGHVWMPWSMNFQGNFFIHGRTYYSDGTLTSRTYTGGCIRLDTEDAKKVFDAVDNGTPVLVFEQSFSSDTFKYEDKSSSLSAPIYLAADIRNNHVFAGKNSTEQVPIASITKLMTALIATEYINLDNKALVSKDAVVYTSKPRLTPGTEVSVYQLLFPLLMESSNEAAETIARHYGRNSFIKHMNEKAASIGMRNTQFTDPSGASEGNVSTAEDLFMLAKYIYNNRSFIFHITSGKLKESAYGTAGFADLANFNDFVDTPYFFGGKNGKTTAAAETSLSVFEFPVGGSTRPIVNIVLRSQNGRVDAAALLSKVTAFLKK